MNFGIGSSMRGAVRAGMIVASASTAIAHPGEFIGHDGCAYFIEVPEGQINQFFQWAEESPTIISGHRGGFAPGFPENAIETFENTQRFAPALLEVDLRRTLDGVWILMHDGSLDRTTTGSGFVPDKTWAEIQGLLLVDNDGLMTSFRVPRLEAALDWAEGRAILELDLKVDSLVGEVVQIVTDRGAEDVVRFIADSIAQARQIHDLNPGIHIGLGASPANLDSILATIDALQYPPGQISLFVNPPLSDLTFYETIRESGMIAVQGLFGAQPQFGFAHIDDLTTPQRRLIIETVAEFSQVIASDYSELAADVLGFGPLPLPGDANGDGQVGFADVTDVLGNWLTNYAPGTGPGDADGNGTVNFADITSVLGNWLMECS